MRKNTGTNTTTNGLVLKNQQRVKIMRCAPRVFLIFP